MIRTPRDLLGYAYSPIPNHYESLQSIKSSFHLANPYKSQPINLSFHLENHCASSKPINSSEFHVRQQKLAETLHSLNASAYIAEPGASAQYFGNISLTSWKLSERPLLLIITPVVVDDKVKANISILTPYFEATRAKLLPVPFDSVRYIEWAEDANPYEIAAAEILAEGNVFMDDASRLFIFDGFRKALPRAIISPVPPEIKELRQRKSEAELDLLKCANEATLLAIRNVHKRMYVGMRESEARKMMSIALQEVGLQNGGCLTLFGENAALPHGSGTDRELGEFDFALFDCGGNLHGYISDVTRTVILPQSWQQIPAEHHKIWNIVQFTQTVASRSAIAGAIAQDVDTAARSFLRQTGYDTYFTHRLGHGIGLEGHEEPYLRGGSLDVIKIGHTFSNEPGIYIEGKVGVRLEDCFYINAQGRPVFFTEGVGGQAGSPWDP
ncbi:peptidase M24 [Rhodocollybia butyracea]|uniref:Peptidase M24 n=1 Tax=Rhodocollybia butyracea TaxID=206335 RepID=A0A9P5Q2I3_9AGAR|nr:peptidase M24 [Rhodocollybia butyracea]